MRLRRSFAVVASIALAFAAGCGAEENVVRVVDSDVMVSHYVPAEAYSAFLAGTLAEADGRLEVAYSRYRDALSVDDTDPLVWARLARVACRMQGHQRDADDALARARALDPSLSTALASEGECEGARKNTAQATTALLSAAANEPRNAELDARANRELSVTAPDAARARMLAATRAYEGRPEAWDALLTWSTEHGDAVMAVHAARGLAAARRQKYTALSHAVVALAGLGALDAAREVASLAVASKMDGVAVDTFVARLAVDHELAGPGAVTSRRGRVEGVAARGRVSLGEVAARSLLLGRPDLARALATDVVAADPRDADAAAVLAVLGKKPEVDVSPRAGTLSPAAFVALASALASREGAGVAALFGRRAKHDALDGRDALVTDLAVELDATLVLSPETDAERLELALRRGEPAQLLPDLDARHELVARLLRPGAEPDARAKLLASRMTDAFGRDPLVTFGTLERSRRERPLTEQERATLLRSVPHPLLLALRVNLDAQSTKTEDKRRLAAFARTPYEHRLAE